MKRKIVWLVLSCLMVLALLATSCAKAEEKAPAPAVKEAAPAVKEAAPVVKEAAPAEKPGMITFSLTKRDGTKITKTVEKPRYGGTITISPGNALEAWDESRIPDWYLQDTVGLVNEDLTTGDWRMGPAGTEETPWVLQDYVDSRYSIGELAESWEIEGPTTIVFHLRQGIRWATPDTEAGRLVGGRELVANDVVFSLRRIYIDIKTSPHLAGNATPLDIYARDKYTVVVEAPPGLTGVTWENVSTWSRIYAPEVAQKYGDYENWKNSVGTGPYILTDYVPQSTLTYKRNPNYWQTDPCYGAEYPLPYADSVKVLRIPDRSTQMAALRTGKVDRSRTAFETEDFKSLLKTTRHELQWVKLPPTIHRLIAWRLNDPELPWYDIRVRRALMMAVDHEGWVRDLLGGDGEELNFLVTTGEQLTEAYTEPQDLPPSADGFDNRKLYCNESIGITQEQRITEAKKLLADAGYPQGFKAEYCTIRARVEDWNLEVVVDAWSKIGVDLKLDVVEPGVFESMRQKRTWTQLVNHSGGTGHLYNMMYFTGTGYWNQPLINDPYLNDALLKMSPLWFQPEKRAKVMKEVNQYIIDKIYYGSLPAAYSYNVWQPWLKNFNGEWDVDCYDAMDIAKYMWVDQDLKKSLGY